MNVLKVLHKVVCVAHAGRSVLRVKLTESSFHVIGRTCRGIPDQLSFRSSSVEKEQKQQRDYYHFRFTAEALHAKTFPSLCSSTDNTQPQ